MEASAMLTALRLALLVLIAAAPLSAQTSTADLEAAVRADPKSGPAHVTLGKQYFKEGRYKDAARQFNRVLVDKGDTLAAAGRAKLCRIIALSMHKAGDDHTAQIYIDRARKDAPADDAVMKVAGMISAGQVPAPADPPAKPANRTPTGFFRVSDVGGGMHALQTGRATMVSPDGKVTVILDGMCHMGEAAYYKGVQDSLVPLDVVLYEAVVMQPGDTAELGKVNPHDPVHQMAPRMGLVAQTATIDYTRPNFVWADITLKELVDYEHSPGFVAAVTGTRQEQPAAGADDDVNASDLREIMVPTPGAARPSPDRQRELRGKFAEMVQSSGGDLSAMGAPKATAELLIFRRNDYVMRGLTEQVEKHGGKGTFSILYGAGHMPDLARRLDCMGYKVTRMEWRNVWSY